MQALFPLIDSLYQPIAAGWPHGLEWVAAMAANFGLAGVLSNVLTANVSDLPQGKHLGRAIELLHMGTVRLSHLAIRNADTEIYLTDHPGVLVKMFDLDCDKADELSYGPYVSFGLELENFEDLMRIEELRPFLPAYYGAAIDYESKFAFIAMEFLEGQNLKSWSEAASGEQRQPDWLEDFRAAVYETLSIMTRFHKYGIILVDFKPENVIRRQDGGIKFVDLGAFFGARQQRETHKYIYSATPDHAEVLIDASNIETGHPVTEASDIFSAGVALFEMATASSRLQIDDHTADQILQQPDIYLFRDSQVRDIWKSYPHLASILPEVDTQLKERRILFADFWHILKGYVAHQLSDWEALPEEQQGQILLATGTTFIMEQLPPEIQWLAGPIAQATTLRSIRLRSVVDFMRLLMNPVSAQVREDIQLNNCFVRSLLDQEQSVDFVEWLNTWDVRWNGPSGQWAIAARFACGFVTDGGQYTFLTQAVVDDHGHRYYQVVGDFEADDVEGGKLTLSRLNQDRTAWLG